MEKQQAYQFVHHAIDTIFIDANSEQLDDFYHTDALIHIGEYSFNIKQIKQRIEFIHNTYEKRQHNLHDVIVLDELIIFQDRQQAIDKRNNQSIDLTMTGTYQLKKGKVQQAWLISKNKIDYLEKTSEQC